VNRLRAYYRLTKPGIIYGNAFTATGGFLLGARGHVHVWLFLAMLGGMSLVIAAACVYNNFMDRDIDQKMARTRKRALVQGTISGAHALTYATLLGVVGFAVLSLWVNALVVLVGLIGFIDYVALYDIAKRRSVYGTLVGSISGAAPIVAGYCAATDRFDGGVLILFFILVFWQMPHFYAIAMYRADDYAAASIPVVPLKQGFHAAKIQIMCYIAAFIVAISTLTVFGYASYTYLVVMMLLGVAWLWRGFQGFGPLDDKKWARKMFFFSLIVIVALSTMLSLDSLLP